MIPPTLFKDSDHSHLTVFTPECLQTFPMKDKLMYPVVPTNGSWVTVCVVVPFLLAAEMH